MGKLAAGAVCACMTIVSLLLAMIMLAVHLDADSDNAASDWPSYAWAVPLWAAQFGLTIVYYVVWLEHGLASLGALLWFFLINFLVFLWSLLLVLRIERVWESLSYTAIMSPLMLATVFLLLLDRHWPVYKFTFEKYRFRKRHFRRSHLEVMPRNSLLSMFAIFLLTGLKLDQVIETSWSWVLVPVWIIFGMSCCLMTTFPDFDAWLLGTCCSMMAVLVFFLLLDLWLEDIIPHVSYVFIPGGLVLCCGLALIWNVI